MYLLNTNLVSELRKVTAGKADPGLAAWAESVEAGTLFIQPSRCRDWSWACCGSGRILVVATRNLADFKATGVRLLNPWQQR